MFVHLRLGDPGHPLTEESFAAINQFLLDQDAFSHLKHGRREQLAEMPNQLDWEWYHSDENKTPYSEAELLRRTNGETTTFDPNVIEGLVDPLDFGEGTQQMRNSLVGVDLLRYEKKAFLTRHDDGNRLSGILGLTGEYSGGILRVYSLNPNNGRLGVFHRARVSLGDFVLFDASKQHDLTPVTDGKREVLAYVFDKI